MNTIGEKIRSQSLLRIKQIIDKDNNGENFVIVRTKKNMSFMREYGLSSEDVKDIIKQLSVEDCFSGPESDRNPKYEGAIFKFCPMFEGIKLYIKIRIENTDKSICLSIHEFGLYDEVN